MGAQRCAPWGATQVSFGALENSYFLAFRVLFRLVGSRRGAKTLISYR
jgi:hypothetical protein